jgi:hypothetical protein
LGIGIGVIYGVKAFWSEIDFTRRQTDTPSLSRYEHGPFFEIVLELDGNNGLSIGFDTKRANLANARCKSSSPTIKTY